MHEGGELMSGYNSALELIEAEKKKTNINIVRLAKVTGIQNQKARITFFGEGGESQKEYPYLAGYVPTSNDIVALLPQGDTYIILGKLTTEAPGTNSYALQSDLDKIINGQTKVASSSSADIATKLGDTSNNIGYYVSGNTRSFIPNTDNTISLGIAGNAYKDIYLARWMLANARYNNYGLEMVLGTNPDFALIRPTVTDGVSLGAAARKFRNIYATSIYQNGSAVSTSDKRKKKEVKTLSNKFKALLMSLRPVSYKYKDGESGRLHTGFIAQEVEESMKDNNITSEEFAGLVIQPNGEYGLRYEEFIALQTAVIQEHEAKIKELEERLNGLQRSTNS